MNKLPPKHIASLIPACCHPGNNRVDVGTNGAIWQAMDYYPFGLTMASSYLPGRQRWLFGGKELDRTSGLELFDFEARAYDPATGRFRQPDPLAEKYYPLSSYLYCAANPLINIDPTGMEGVKIVDTENKIVTIKANYYVVTSTMQYRDKDKQIVDFGGYNTSDIRDLNGYSEDLNELDLKVTEGEYIDYSLRFDLEFKDGGDLLSCQNLAETDQLEGNTIGNVFQLGCHDLFTHLGFNEKYNADGSFKVVGAVTESNKYIIMNKPYDTKLNRIHELFHTFGLPDITIERKQGIMDYPPNHPTNEDANKLMYNNYLPLIKQ